MPKERGMSRIELERQPSLGSALDAALERGRDLLCLIEADRERENVRLTYGEFAARGLFLARALEECGFGAGHRAAIVMSNQSKWLLSAYAVFRRGGVLVPLDFKLSGAEHRQLIAHSGAQVVVTEYPVWRQMALPAEVARLVLVSEAPPNADLRGARRWEDFSSELPSAPVARQRSDLACIVYSSGTGGRPKGCMLTHDNYLEQCAALVSLFPFGPGSHYLSVLPTNHAIDFMVGFVGPFVCGATVVHLRTLRPEYVREAFTKYRITYMALVPMVLKNLETGLRTRFAALPASKRFVLNRLIALNRALTKKAPNLEISRKLLKQVHSAFGGELRTLFVGGAFMSPETLKFFYDLGIQVSNGYGLTEAGTAVTLNDLKPFRADTVGRPLPGMEVRIVDPNSEGIGQVAIRSRTVMSHYLDDPELTAETIVEGWLLTGDLGRFDSMGHLQLSGRVKNMIVTEEGKNVYPEDIENAFEGLPVKEFCVFAANYIWPERSMLGEKLVIVVHLDDGQEMTPALRDEIFARNRKLLNFKRLSGYLIWNEEFPRTASMKIKRVALAEAIRNRFDRSTALQEL
jgi:long-chain acyl-CoA synthetase